MSALTAAPIGYGTFNKLLCNLDIKDSPCAERAWRRKKQQCKYYCIRVPIYGAEPFGILRALPEVFNNPKKALKYLGELG